MATKKIIRIGIFVGGLVYLSIAFALPKQSDYPHWDFNNPGMYKKLVKIDSFINKNRNKNYVAIFDWDGTLYNEKIPLKQYSIGALRAGQPAWHIWASYHLYDPKYPNLFPMFHALDGKGQIYLDRKDDYLEGQTNVKVDDYNKFSQIATIEANMTPVQFTTAVNGYLKLYPTKNYVFYPMLDIMQHLINSGFHVWIVTGSNPYFISVLLRDIEKNIYYTKYRKYHFNLGSTPYNPKLGHIAGNMARLTVNHKFSMIYDDRYTTNNLNQLYVVEGEGKKIVLERYIPKREKTPIIFYAGNSGGDYAAMQYVLSQKNLNTLGIGVNPQGTLKQLKEKYFKKLIFVPVKY
ncbi:MAG TPA: hypothetical protein DIC51_00475 [Coxiellaceae bacterium]|nr:hypothetical protein [Coxiellaceae bacterium]